MPGIEGRFGSVDGRDGELGREIEGLPVEGRLIEGRLVEGLLTEGRLTDGRLGNEGRLIDGPRLTEGRERPLVRAPPPTRPPRPRWANRSADTSDTTARTTIGKQTTLLFFMVYTFTSWRLGPVPWQAACARW